jgi:hypothetical protein
MFALGVIVTAGGLIYDSLADDIKQGAEVNEKQDAALEQIKIYQAVDQAQQQSQTELLRAVLEELKRENAR